MDDHLILLEIASHLTQGVDTDTQLLKALRSVSTKAYSTLSPVYWNYVNPKLKLGPNYKLPTEFSMDLIHTYRHLELPKLGQLNTNFASLTELNLIRERIFPQLRQVTVNLENVYDEDEDGENDEQRRTKRQKILETSGEPDLFSLLPRMDKLKVLTLKGYKEEEHFGFRQAFETIVSRNAKIEVVWGLLVSTDEPSLNRLMDQLTPWKSRIILIFKICYITSTIEYNMIKKLSEFCELKMGKLKVNMNPDWEEYDLDLDRFRTFDSDGFNKLLHKLMELPKKLTISRYLYNNLERNFLLNVPEGKVYANITTLSLNECSSTLDFLHLFPKLEKLKLLNCPVNELLVYDENYEEEGLNNIRQIIAREPKLKYLYIGGETSDLSKMDEGYDLLEDLVEKLEVENFGVFDYLSLHKNIALGYYDF